MSQPVGWNPVEPQMFHVLVSRQEWGAEPPKYVTKLQAPARNLRYTFTATEDCETEEACVKAVQDIQRDHMQRGCSDIMYNFLVGGDGRVYEGRGWEVEGEIPPKFEDLKRQTIDVAFIGNFVPSETETYHVLPHKMTDPLHSLTEWAVNYGYCDSPIRMTYHNFEPELKVVEGWKKLSRREMYDGEEYTDQISAPY